MDKKYKPNVIISKNTTPVIYLDTCLLIELLRFENGCCDNAHKQEIGELYDMLLTLMESKKIICVLGNQMEEMGATQSRKNAREFAYRFTNAIFLEPFQIEKMQNNFGYNAYINNESEIKIDAKSIFKESSKCSNSSIEIHVTTIYKQEKAQKLKENKTNLSSTLNKMKSIGKIAKTFDEQLSVELNGDFQAFKYILEHYNDSMESYIQSLDYLRKIYKCTGIDGIHATNEERKKSVENYCHFLLSEHHHALPYVWIQAILFAHLMKRSNKIIPSDYLDIIWASSYLPFVDYAITDGNFYSLLNHSGVAKKYNTKIYSMKTLNELLVELSHLQ